MQLLKYMCEGCKSSDVHDIELGNGYNRSVLIIDLWGIENSSGCFFSGISSSTFRI